MSDMHRHLLTIVRELPEDYNPWGQNIRWADPNKAYPDCSSGCKHALWLEDLPGQPIGMDWCVCANPKSHRVGLLTFEHQGCQAYEYDGDPESDEEE